MSEQGALRRPVLLLSAGLVTATIAYFAYSAYSHRPQETTGLQRRNAIRRSRRHWRRGFPPRDLTVDPVAEAIRSLNGRIASRESYGTYNNTLLFTLDPEALDRGHYDLLPQNLGPIYNELLTLRHFTALEKEILNHHIESIFLQNFLVHEFPAGYIIGDDVESLIHELRSHGINEEIIRIMVDRFDTGKPPTPVNWDLHEMVRPAAESVVADVSLENVTPRDAIDALRGPAYDDESTSGWGDDEESDPGGSQGMLDLLYHIAGEQAKREGLVHRGVECNSCGVIPIRGIRYHCVNCFDYDLCETCEAQQVHHKTHVFYKIRIPAPSRGHIKQVIPAWYPGNPNACPISLPRALARHLMDVHKMEKTELDSHYEQFKCLAGHQLSADVDPAGLGVAIDRKSFDLYFTTTSEDRPPPQNLLYDRIFAFYDANNDDLITFDEYVQGMSNWQIRTRAARVQRMFQGYDLDGDGYVSRRDFLRIFRAYYAWHKEFNREMIMNHADLEDDIRDAVRGSQPISAAFGWNDFAGHTSRGGQDKTVRMHGDLEISEGPDGVLQNDSDLRGDRARFVGDVAVHNEPRILGSRSFRPRPPNDDPIVYIPYGELQADLYSGHLDDATEEELSSSDPRHNIYRWPPLLLPEQSDVVAALGADIPLDEIMDPTDQARVIYSQSQRMDDELDDRRADLRHSAIRQRWQRRQFYFDEDEGLLKPPGYTEPDSSDDEDPASDVSKSEADVADNLVNASRRQSMRSRSSSKVRFDDSAIDTDYETRSNTSSRSVPLNERWGGFDLSEPEKDIGKEILYQAVQQGFNELLDCLFKEKEDKAMEALASKKIRQKWSDVLEQHENKLQCTTAEGTLSSVYDPNSGRTRRLSVTSQEPQKLSLDEENVDVVVDAAEQNGGTDVVMDDSNNAFDAATVKPVPIGSDPTLPQNRPNDSFTATLMAAATRSRSTSDIDGHAQSQTRQEHEQEEDDSNVIPTEATLTQWITHKAIDTEATERGGYGRLSFEEFKKKMVQESISDVLKVLETDSEDENEIWSSTADLGRLSFLGSWLEMAQF